MSSLTQLDDFQFSTPCHRRQARHDFSISSIHRQARKKKSGKNNFPTESSLNRKKSEKFSAWRLDFSLSTASHTTSSKSMNFSSSYDLWSRGGFTLVTWLLKRSEIVPYFFLIGRLAIIATATHIRALSCLGDDIKKWKTLTDDVALVSVTRNRFNARRWSSYEISHGRISYVTRWGRWNKRISNKCQKSGTHLKK